MASDPVKCLPNDVLHKIFSKLCLRDLGKASIASKGWRAICMSIPFFSYEEFLNLTLEDFKNYAFSSTTSSIQAFSLSLSLILKLMANLIWYSIIYLFMSRRGRMMLK